MSVELPDLPDHGHIKDSVVAEQEDTAGPQHVEQIGKHLTQNYQIKFQKKIRVLAHEVGMKAIKT
jgi:hypothetical protein